jgi:hypothetical protein
VIDFREEQLENPAPPIVLRVLGRLTDTSDEQKENACVPIVTTVLGSTMAVREVQP